MPKQDDLQIDPAYQMSWWIKKPGDKKTPPVVKPEEEPKDKAKSKPKNESFRDFLSSRGLV